MSCEDEAKGRRESKETVANVSKASATRREATRISTEVPVVQCGKDRRRFGKFEDESANGRTLFKHVLVEVCCKCCYKSMAFSYGR